MPTQGPTALAWARPPSAETIAKMGCPCVGKSYTHAETWVSLGEDFYFIFPIMQCFVWNDLLASF